MQNHKTFGFVVAINKKNGQNHSSNRVPQKMKRNFTQRSERGSKCSSVHYSSLQTAYWDSLPTSLINVNVFHFPLHDMWSSDLPGWAANRDRISIDWFWLEWHFLTSNQILHRGSGYFMKQPCLPAFMRLQLDSTEQVWAPAPNISVHIKIRD